MIEIYEFIAAENSLRATSFANLITTTPIKRASVTRE